MVSKNVTGIEIRFSSPLSSLKDVGGDRRTTQFNVDYLITFDDGSTARVSDNPAHESKIFNTAVFTRAIYDALSEFARNVADGTWHARSEAA